MKLNIRQAQRADFGEVFGLLQQLWADSNLDYDLLLGVYNKAIDSEVQKLIIGELDKKIISFCSLTIKNSLWQAGNLGHIDELIIDKEYRNIGFGKEMMDSITIIAKELNCRRIELDSAFYRKEAHEFYVALGYENRAYLFSKSLI